MPIFIQVSSGGQSEDANKINVASSTCPESDARQIIVEYRPVNS